MNDLFAHAKNILVIGVTDIDIEIMRAFQDVLGQKAQQAQINFETINSLLSSPRAASSCDIILYDLLSKRDSPTNTEQLSEFLRLLHPNGYLIIHVEHVRHVQTIGYFKMSGFDNCNPLDTKSSFLIENKDEDTKRYGSLWLCQKPSFEIGYSVPLRKTATRLVRQGSSTAGLKKTWAVIDNDDLIEADDLMDDSDLKQSNVKNSSILHSDGLHDTHTRECLSHQCYTEDFNTNLFRIDMNCGKNPSCVRHASEDCTCGFTSLIEHDGHSKVQPNRKSSSGDYYVTDASQRAGGDSTRALPLFKNGERVALPTVSDV